MPAKIIDGKAIAEQVKQQVKAAVEKRLAEGKIAPRLDVIIVGNNPASESYVSHKVRGCEFVGMISTVHHLASDSTLVQIASVIDAANANPAVHGILLQLPLPDHLDPSDLLERIHPKKDVDGFHPFNLGRLVQRRPLLRPCTPYGVMTLLKSLNQPIAGLHAVIVGASNLVGRPMALELLLAKCTTTICHRFTQDLPQEIAQADILVVAIGKPHFIQSDWIKKGAIVIDVGFSRLDNGKIVGDVDFDSACERAGFITPVPGGVGQMTVATLLENTLLAASLQEEV